MLQFDRYKNVKYIESNIFLPELILDVQNNVFRLPINALGMGTPKNLNKT